MVFFEVWAKSFSTPVFSKKKSVSDDLIAHVTNFLRIGLTRQYIFFSDLSFLKPFEINIFITATS